MRFFASFHYAQNDSKLVEAGIWEGWFCGFAAKPPLPNAKVFMNLSFRYEASQSRQRQENLIKLFRTAL
jgi:hypothetical protein